MSAWRSGGSAVRQAITALKQAGRGTNVDPATVCSHLESVLASYADASETDVVELLTISAQQLLLHHDQTQHVHTSGLHSELAFCKLLSALLSGTRRINLQGGAANIVAAALRLWVNPLHDGVSSTASDAAVLQQEALGVVAHFLQENLQHVAEHERAALIAVLLSLAQPPDCLSAPSAAPAASGANTAAAAQQQLELAQSMEVQRLALQALSSWYNTTHSSVPGSKGLPAEAVVQLQACLVSTLQLSCTGGARIQETHMHSRYYATVFRSLAHVITEGRKGWVPHAALLVECLCKFFCYGLHQGPASPASSVSQSEGGAAQPQISPSPSTSGASPRGGARYCPPHLRATVAKSPVDGSRGVKSSDNDVSDSECGAGAAPDRYKSSKVRLAVCACLQTMAKADSRTMHPHWTTLLPVQQPLQAKPLTPHLVTMLLHDPVPKVRSMAAGTIGALLEGPAARGFLAVAEARAMGPVASSRAPPVRGFVTVSTSLGQMVVSLHAGLLHALAHEAAGYVVAGVLRVMCVLIGAAPIDRLPAQLLPTALTSLRSRWAALTAAGGASAVHMSELQAMQPAYLACIAEAMSTKQPVAGVRSYLSGAAASNQAGSEPPASGLVQELLAAAVHTQPTVRIEALAALKGFATHYIFLLDGMWDEVQRVVVANLHELPGTVPQLRRNSSFGSSVSVPTARRSTGGWRSGTQQGGDGGTSAQASEARPGGGSATGGVNSSAAEDKAMQHAVKLLGEFLAASSKQWGLGADASKQFSDTDAIAPTTGPPAVLGPRTQVGGAPGTGAGAGTGLTCAEAADRLCSWWQQGLAILLPTSQAHVSDMVRAAALGVCTDLSCSLFERLPSELQLQLVQRTAQATKHDGAAAVRAAGCKVLGACCAFPPVRDLADGSTTALSALSHGLQDSVMSVRIAACWGLASMCESVAQLAGASSTTSITADVVPAALQPHHLSQLQLMGAAAMAAAQGDADKVRANGVRGVGALLALMSPALAHAAGLELDSWLEGALACIQSCMTTGNMKVQWTACSAAESVLRNEALMGMPHAALRVGPILLLLIMLVRDSANYKIRTHAAAALAAPRTRALYGRVFPDVLLVVCGVLDALASGAGDTTAWATGGAGGGAGAGNNATASSQSSATAGTSAPAASTDENRNFPNFRYLPGLQDQLRDTLLHLLSLAVPADGEQAREAMARRVDVMHATLDAVTAAAVREWSIEADASSGGSAAADSGALGGATGSGDGDSLQLPSDPFQPAGDGPSPGATTRGVLTSLQSAVQLAHTGTGVPAGAAVTLLGQASRVGSAAAGLLRLIQGLPPLVAQQHGAAVQQLANACML